MRVSSEGTVRLAAVGDLLLTPAVAGREYRRKMELLAPEVRELLAHCDVVFANLECTLAGSGQTIPTEPRVISSPEFVKAVLGAGFNVVSLANNHMFDCLQGGFHQIRDLLKGMKIAWFGAGYDVEEATAPARLEVNGVRLAFLAGADRRSGPYQFAGPGRFGVAPLDVPRICGQIRDLRKQVDHVILSLHWGEERFLVPSPAQIDQARQLAEAGASMILGHHPHVIQGLEWHGGAPIAYSLGNLVADDVHYDDGDVLTWNRLERTGCLLLAELDSRNVAGVRQLATYDDGVSVGLDQTGLGPRRLARANRALARGVTPRRYAREHFWVKTVLPVLAHLRPSKLRLLRARHLRKALALARASRRAR